MIKSYTTFWGKVWYYTMCQIGVHSKYKKRRANLRGTHGCDCCDWEGQGR